MENLIISKIRDITQNLGLNPENVMSQSRKDNLTLPKPRVELQFLPLSYKRSGRLLSAVKKQGQLTLTKELYEINLPVAMQIFATDEKWLESFAHNFIKNMPKGFNDANGHWIKALAVEGKWHKEVPLRIGREKIEIFKNYSFIIHLNFYGRLTKDETINLINHAFFKIKGLTNV